jgi:hypothetical protein
MIVGSNFTLQAGRLRAGISVEVVENIAKGTELAITRCRNAMRDHES